jgi:hypothetical protein
MVQVKQDSYIAVDSSFQVVELCAIVFTFYPAVSLVVDEHFLSRNSRDLPDCSRWFDCLRLHPKSFLAMHD